MSRKSAKKNFLKRMGLLIGLSAAAACAGRVDKTANAGISCDNMQTIVVRTGNTPYPIDEIIDSTEYVRLETTDDNLIGYISQIRTTDDCIVVTDKQNQTVFVFDRRGKALGSIKRTGRGPQEYTGISAVSLTPDGQRIVITDCWSKKALYFDRAGRFLYSKPLPDISIREMEFDGSDRIVLTVYPSGERNPADTIGTDRDPRSTVLVTDTSFRIEKGMFPALYNTGRFNWGNIFNLQKNKTGIHFTPTYGDTVYRISEAGVEALYRLDLSGVDGWANPSEDITNESFERLNKSRATFNGSFLDTKTHALFHISNKENEPSITLLYDKERQESYPIDLLKSKNPFAFQLIMAVQRPGSTWDDRVIVDIQSHLFYYGDTPVNRNIIPEKMMEGYSEDSNPVLMLVPLKSPEQK